jgi:hypothetical protein
VSERGFANTKDGSRWRIDAPAKFAGDLNRSAAASGITLVELFEEKASLEATFMEMTGDDARVPE